MGRRGPTFRVRWLMAAVAVAAVGLGAYRTRQHSAKRAYYLDRAKVYASRSEEFAAKAVEARRRAGAFLRAADGVDGELAEKNRRWADDEILRAKLFRQVADFDAAQEQRFRLAADRPWGAAPPSETPDRPVP